MESRKGSESASARGLWGDPLRGTRRGEEPDRLESRNFYHHPRIWESLKKQTFVCYASSAMAYTRPGKNRERVFCFVQERVLAGSPPTIREVQRALGFRAVESARAHLDALVAAGRLTKEPGNTSRGYRLPGEKPPIALVPILGKVQAGALTTALEESEGYLEVSSRFPAEELFVLRVRGESMINAGILPGDLVIVRRQPIASNGDIVVALVEDEATVKRLRLRHDRVELHPENPHFEPIVPPPTGVRILGLVIEVRRYLYGAPHGKPL